MQKITTNNYTATMFPKDNSTINTMAFKSEVSNEVSVCINIFEHASEIEHFKVIAHATSALSITEAKEMIRRLQKAIKVAENL